MQNHFTVDLNRHYSCLIPTNVFFSYSKTYLKSSLIQVKIANSTTTTTEHVYDTIIPIYMEYRKQLEKPKLEIWHYSD